MNRKLKRNLGILLWAMAPIIALVLAAHLSHTEGMHVSADVWTASYVLALAGLIPFATTAEYYRSVDAGGYWLPEYIFVLLQMAIAVALSYFGFAMLAGSGSWQFTVARFVAALLPLIGGWLVGCNTYPVKPRASRN